MTANKLRFAPYSHSKLGTYSTCPRKFKYSVIDKAPRDPSPTEALTKGRAVHRLLEKYPEVPDSIATTADQADHQNIVRQFANSSLGQKYLHEGQSCRELKFGLTRDFEPTSYYDRDAMFRGSIDYVLRHGDQLHLIDWKTGKAKDQRWQEYDQLIRYAVYFFVRFPSIQDIRISYVYVEHDDHENPMVLSRKYLDKYKSDLADKIQECEEDTEFPKTPNKLCDFCDFRTHCSTDSTDR